MARTKNTRNPAGSGSIRKKTITRKGQQYTYWEARYSVGRDPGTGKPVRKTVTGKSQKEVAEKLRAATKNIDTGEYIAPTKATVKQWITLWLDTFCVNKVRESTLYAYKNIAKKHIYPSIGAMELQAVKGVDIQRVYNTMTANDLSGKTVKNVAAVMHKAFSVAQKQGYIVSNPCEGA